MILHITVHWVTNKTSNEGNKMVLGPLPCLVQHACWHALWVCCLLRAWNHHARTLPKNPCALPVRGFLVPSRKFNRKGRTWCSFIYFFNCCSTIVVPIFLHPTHPYLPHSILSACSYSALSNAFRGSLKFKTPLWWSLFYNVLINLKFIKPNRKKWALISKSWRTITEN